MTNSQPPVFESVADEFFDGYYSQVRGYVRQEVIRARLQGYLISGIGSILDYGAGDGRDAEWAVDNSHAKVDYWDEETNAVNRATISVKQKNLTEQLDILKEDPIINPNPRYDLVMLHGVIQYMEIQKARDFMDKLTKLIVTGGLLSIATANYDVKPIGSEIEPGAKMYINQMGLDSIAYSATYLEEWLRSLGLSSNIRGIRCLTEADRRDISRLSRDELDRIIAEESHWTTREDSVEYGQMLHVIAYKQ